MKKISMLLVSIIIILSFTGCNNKKTSEDFKKIDYDFLNESVSCSVKDGKLFLSVPAQKSFLIKI